MRKVITTWRGDGSTPEVEIDGKDMTQSEATEYITAAIMEFDKSEGSNEWTYSNSPVGAGARCAELRFLYKDGSCKRIALC